MARPATVVVGQPTVAASLAGTADPTFLCAYGVLVRLGRIHAWECPYQIMNVYAELFSEIKTRIRQAQVKAAFSVNAEMIFLYWDVGRMVCERQGREGWGSGVIPRLARDLRNELPDVKGFSERNIKLMTQFYREYPHLVEIGQRSVAQLRDDSQVTKELPQHVAELNMQAPHQKKGQQLVAQLGWAQNVLLMQKVKDLPTRSWYIQQTIEQGWSRDTLGLMIKSQVHKRQGAAISNFQQRLPDPQSDLAQQALKDPYIFDFLTLSEPFRERELETGLVEHLEKFLLELGQGFAFVGRQYHLEVSDNDFYLDLVFYHLKLRCFVVIDLKKGEFKPEYAGKMNFYCSVVDDRLKHKSDQPTIGLILCQAKDRIVAEYALRDIHKPIGVSDYELTRTLPENLKSLLPTIEEIEAELQSESGDGMK
jgi:predicted nuclease of restriction endonuclease-like (RecB) superfamily